MRSFQWYEQLFTGLKALKTVANVKLFRTSQDLACLSETVKQWTLTSSPREAWATPNGVTGPLSQPPCCCGMSASFLRPLSASVKTSVRDALSAKCCGEASPGLRVKRLALRWCRHTLSPLQEKWQVEWELCTPCSTFLSVNPRLL